MLSGFAVSMRVVVDQQHDGDGCDLLLQLRHTGTDLQFGWGE